MVIQFVWKLRFSDAARLNAADTMMHRIRSYIWSNGMRTYDPPQNLAQCGFAGLT